MECVSSLSQKRWASLYLESHLNSSSFRIPGCSVLRSDCLHSQSGILSPDNQLAMTGIVIFVGRTYHLNFLHPLSSFDPYSDYVGVNMSLTNSFSLSFLTVYAPPIHSSTKSPSPPPFFRQKYLHSGALQLPQSPVGLIGYFWPPWWESICLGVLLGPLPLNYPNTTTPLYPFSGSRSSPDISFAPSSLAAGRCFRTWPLNHLQILLLVSLSPVFHPNKPPHFLQFSKTSVG